MCLPAKNRIYYGWYIVAITLFAHFMVVGSGFYVLNAFMLLMCTQVLWQFYLLYVCLFLGSGTCGGIVASTAVNNWFVLH